MRLPANENKATIIKRFQKALTDFSMIADGDRILVGLSGGKDSLCLLEMLAMRMKIFKPRFEVEALHVRMDNIDYESNTSYLENFASSLGVKLHIRTSSLTQAQTSARLHVFFVRGQGASRCSRSHKSWGSTRLRLAITTMISYIRQ